MSERTSLVLTTLFGAVMLLLAIGITIVTPPAGQYEISIYDAYSVYFWGLLTGAFLVGGLVVFWSARRPRDRTWQAGVALMVLTNATLLLLPYIRGYQMYGRADALTHIGFSREIASLGYVPVDNIYPSTHVFLQIVASVTGTELMTLAVAVPIVFSAVYFGSMYYLLLYLYNSRREVLFRLPFVMLPVLGAAHVGVRPFDLSVLVAPLVIYLFVRGQRNPTPTVRAAFVIAVVASIFLHPLSALFLVSAFGVWVLAKRTPISRAEYVNPTNAFSLMFAVFVAWYLHFASILFRFETVTQTLLGTAGGEPPIESYSETVSRASPPVEDLLRVWLFKYGVEFMVFALGFGFLALVAILVYRNQYAADSYETILAYLLVAFSFGGLLFLIQDLIVGTDRPWQFAKVGGIALAGGMFYLIWKHLGSGTMRDTGPIGFDISIATVFLVLVLVSTFSLYPSPLSSEKNYQVTQMELEGAGWLAETGTTSSDVYEIGFKQRRYHQAQYGLDENPFVERGGPPYRFNYTEHRHLGESYSTDNYLIITRLGRTMYPESFPNYRPLWRYTPEDYDRLERDRTVTRVYDNGDFDLYLVDGVGNETAVQQNE